MDRTMEVAKDIVEVLTRNGSLYGNWTSESIGHALSMGSGEAAFIIQDENGKCFRALVSAVSGE